MKICPIVHLAAKTMKCVKLALKLELMTTQKVLALFHLVAQKCIAQLPFKKWYQDG